MKRSIGVGVVATMAVVMTACAGSSTTDGGGASGPTGDPVSGGTAQLVEPATPTTLDPAVMQNTAGFTPLTGNSLYGQLVLDNAETGELEYGLLTDFSSTDGGNTFNVVVRDGVTFSDGTPFDAEAIKYNWDRVKDPATGSSVISTAQLIDTINVVDDHTLTLAMAEPQPYFPNAVLFTQMNWIGSPAALEKGREAFDANPIGAGPFTLESWVRGGVITMVRNATYWDAPRPYLDKLEIRGIGDTSQRLNTLVGGQVDFALESTPENTQRAQDSGLVSEPFVLNGGNALVLNTSKAPFDDLRARQAVSDALDLEAINQAAFGGLGEVPDTLFLESSPFFRDIPLHEYNPEKAQQLFDELAAEGKPVDFSMAVFPYSVTLFEAVQAQLSQYKNVSIKADQRDISETGKVSTSGDFQMLQSAYLFQDPDPRLWLNLYGGIGANFSKINDPQLNDALDAGRFATDVNERAKAYQTVQERFAALVPAIILTRSTFGVVHSPTMAGVKGYGLGSQTTQTLWIQP